jgi:glutamyl-tRNA reductase
MITGLLGECSGLSRQEFAHCIYRKYSRDVVHHLLTVASSLDSMVIGENEILGQIKQAYRDSVLHNKSGIILNRLFHQSFNTAKKVRTRTGISQNPLSIAYIAVEQAKNLFCNDLSGRKALLIGAGEMGELILKYLTKNNITDITIANRSLENAQAIVDKINQDAHIIHLNDIEAAASCVDIIITSVTGHDYLLTNCMIKAIIDKRGKKPLCIIDIAVPRNVDPAVRGIDSVYLFNIDDLKEIAEENMKNRLKEVEAAQQIVQADAADLLDWYEGLEIVPLIVRMQNIFNTIRDQELRKYRRRQLKHLSDDDLELVEDLTKQIVSKILHNPIMAIKENKESCVTGYNTTEAIKEKIRLLEELFKI